jgi:hypothetical protein
MDSTARRAWFVAEPAPPPPPTADAQREVLARRQAEIQHSAGCEDDRAGRLEAFQRYQTAYRQVLADGEAARVKLVAYAKAHCRYLELSTWTTAVRADANTGVLRAVRVQDGTVWEWKCPPGAPLGIDGNTDIGTPQLATLPDWPVDADRRTAVCQDIDVGEFKR